jgi:general secretion pathway protein K
MRIRQRISLINLHRSKGFIAIAAIAFAGLVMAMSIEFATIVRLNNLRAANAIHGFRAQQITDGMARLAAWRLANGQTPPMNSEPILCRWRNSAVVEIKIQDLGGLIDLNLASEPLLQNVFVAAGETEAQASIIAQSIIDYRDPDQQATSGGPEAPAVSGLPMKNAPFETVEELDSAARLDDNTYRAAKAVFTPFSYQSTIDPETAPASLRKLMSEPASGPFTGKLVAYAGVSQKRTFLLTVRAQLKGGQRFERIATVNVLRQPERPYVFLTWNDGPNEGNAIADVPSMPSCFTE